MPRRLLLLSLLLAVGLTSGLALAQGPRSTPGIDTLPNDTSTGTTQYLLAKIVPGTGGKGKLIRAATTDTSIDLYVCLANCGTTGEAKFIFAGEALLTMDASIASGAAGYFVVASTSTAGRGHPQVGAPANGIVVGKLLDDTTTTGQTARVLMLNQAYIPGSGAGTGTVTQVFQTVPSEFTVAGSPVTTSGTLAISKATQTANTVWAGPSSGGAVAPGFRALVAADMPAGVMTSCAGDLGGTVPACTVLQASGLFAFTGVVTPAPLAGDVNDYTGCGGATICRLNGGGGDRTITGLSGGTTGRVLNTCNVGTTNALLFAAQSTSSTAANRLDLLDTFTLPPKACLSLLYDNTTQRWSAWGATSPDYLKVRLLGLSIGDPDTASPFLVDGNDSPDAFSNDYGRDVKILAMACKADAGSPVIRAILSGGSATSVLTGDCTCGNGSFAACAVQSGALAPIVHSYTTTATTNTCSTTPCGMDLLLTGAGLGTTRYITIKAKGLLQ